MIANTTYGNAVYRGDGTRLYGLDAELELKAQSKRDPQTEVELMIWIEKVIGEKLKFPDDLIESLRSGIVLCKLLNSLIPGTIKNINTSRDTALHHMENIGLYLKACWIVGIQSSDLFVSSDLYLRKNVNAVIQNLLAIARAAHTLDNYKGPSFGYKPNTNIQPAKKWDQIVYKGPTFVTDLENNNNNNINNNNSNCSSSNNNNKDCIKCGIEKVCIKCNPSISPTNTTTKTNVNSILNEKEKEREKEKEKELLLKIQNLSNALKEKEEGLKLVNENLEKQRKKNLEDEKVYKDLIETQKIQLTSKDSLIESINKKNSSLIMLTSNSNNNSAPASVSGINISPTPSTSVSTSNSTPYSSSVPTNSSSSSSFINKSSNRNSGVFQTIASYNNKSGASSTLAIPNGSTNIPSSSTILSKCIRCNITTTKTIKYCSSCGELLIKDNGATPNSSTFNKPPITSKSSITVTSSSVSTQQTLSSPLVSTTTTTTINESDKIKTLIATMKQQEEVITKLNQQIKIDKEIYEKEKKQQKQTIDNQQVLLNQKDQDSKKAKESSSFTKRGEFLLSAELKSTNSTENYSSFSRPIGNNSTNTTTITNKELEVLREKVKSLEFKLNEEICKTKAKDSQITLLNEKIQSINSRPKRVNTSNQVVSASNVSNNNNNNNNNGNRTSQQIIVGRKRFNTLKPDASDLTTLVDATLVHLTTILYSKPIEFYQVNSLKDLFSSELGRRRFSQILKMTLKKVPSLQMNESSFEFLLFLISCALQEMNLSKDNDIEAAKILFNSSDLLYRINPKTNQSEFLKDYIRSANIFKELTFWSEYYWSEVSKRHRKVYGNIPDTLDKEIVNNLLAYFGQNMIYFSVSSDQVKNFIIEIAQQHNLPNNQIDLIIASIKDSPLYTSTKSNDSNNNIVSSAKVMEWDQLIENNIIREGFIGCQILNFQGKNLTHYGSYYVEVTEESSMVNYFKETNKDLIKYISIKDNKFLITIDDENKLYGECLNQRIIITKTNCLFVIFWFEINTLSKEKANYIADSFIDKLEELGY
ncbi:hypothetical protein RB653_007621 [Dictyostelium firmibasis]|uniref:Calponin-homology (CH) domain-containing protein n=1 Tax=Dictyostelium firmibasis TaxID=79012 RepID=A0AAN7TUR9_9MYCE